MNEYQQKLEARFRAYSLNQSPAPWRCTWRGSIGGLLEVGFAPVSELLIVVSPEGRGVFDCSTGERVARDYDIDLKQWADPIRLTAEGIGPLGEQTVRMAGIWGGGLPLFTADGWNLNAIPLSLVEYIALLCPPQTDIYSDKTFDQCLKIYMGDPIRACGFSDTGRSFVVAEGSGVSLTLFHR